MCKKFTVQKWVRGIGVVLGFLGSGCVPTLEAVRDPKPVARETFRPHAGQPLGASSESSWADMPWDQFFSSPDFQGLVRIALSSNQELAQRSQEVILAELEVSARSGEYRPKVGVSAGVGVERAGRHTSQGVSDEAHGLPENLGNFGFGLVGSWEADVWGRLRGAEKAARLRYMASVEARRFLVTQLVAELARTYYELLALDNQLEVLRHNLEIQASALEVVRLEKQAARVTELAVQRFEAELLKNRSRVFDVEQQRVQAENRINFLLGRYPEPVRRTPGDFQRTTPSSITTGLPVRLLENRPDVRRALLDLEAAKVDVQVARAAFYPGLKVDASLGYRAFNPAHLLATPDSVVFGLAGGLTAPLLNRRGIEADYRMANARQLQAVLAYEQTVLQAFTDVVNQVSTVENLDKGQVLQRQQVDTLARSVEISGVLFQSARADYMEVLMVRRDALEAEIELIETKRRQFHAMVNLYQALGGGWRVGGEGERGSGGG